MIFQVPFNPNDSMILYSMKAQKFVEDSQIKRSILQFFILFIPRKISFTISVSSSLSGVALEQSWWGGGVMVRIKHAFV